MSRPAVIQHALMTHGGGFLIDDLCSNRIAAGSIKDFNDPFELHFRPGRFATNEEFKRDILQKPFIRHNLVQIAKAVGGDPNKLLPELERPHRLRPLINNLIKDHMEEIRLGSFEHFDQNFKVICCVDENPEVDSEIFMWAYYGDRHTGVRVHFNPCFYDRDGIQLVPIDYKIDPIVYGYDEIRDPADFIAEQIQTKSYAWRHEGETRLLIPKRLLTLAPDIRGQERFWLDIRPNDISRVDLGIRFPESQIVSAVCRLRHAHPTAKIFRTIKDPESYRCGYQPLI